MGEQVIKAQGFIPISKVLKYKPSACDIMEICKQFHCHMGKPEYHTAHCSKMPARFTILGLVIIASLNNNFSAKYLHNHVIKYHGIVM